MPLLADYRALAPGAAGLHTVLNAAVNAPIPAVNDADRADLIQTLIDDVVSARAGQSSRLSTKGRQLALD